MSTSKRKYKEVNLRANENCARKRVKPLITRKEHEPFKKSIHNLAFFSKTNYKKVQKSRSPFPNNRGSYHPTRVPNGIHKYTCKPSPCPPQVANPGDIVERAVKPSPIRVVRVKRKREAELKSRNISITEYDASRQRLGVVRQYESGLIFRTPLAAQTITQCTRNRSRPQMSDLERKRSLNAKQLGRFHTEVGKVLEPSREPLRVKTQWDFLLDEVLWMATEIARERRWRRQRCRTIAQAVLDHFNKAETKAKYRRKQKELKKRRLASFIAKEVRRWWFKVEKLVAIKEEVRLERKSAEASISEMDKKYAREPSPDEKRKRLSKLIRAMKSVEPKGVKATKGNAKCRIPKKMLRQEAGKLREYQHVGLSWLVALYENRGSGILADDSGLGKTVQVIALLAHIGLNQKCMGPHLIIVPSSTVLRWEAELKRWCPRFKVVSYYGSATKRNQSRARLNRGSSHIFITSYTVAVNDVRSLEGLNWRCLILDEAQKVKNFNLVRWKALFKFRSRTRLLLCRTPLQSNLMSLWGVLCFLFPRTFQSQGEFKEWFDRFSSAMNSKRGKSSVRSDLVSRLKVLLKCIMLRRERKEVQKQLPDKTELLVRCHLSQRQKLLYDGFINGQSMIRRLREGKLSSLLKAIVKLRKICNHPDTLEARGVSTPFRFPGISYSIPKIVARALLRQPFDEVSFVALGLVLTQNEENFSWDPPKAANFDSELCMRTPQGFNPLSSFAPFMKRFQPEIVKERNDRRRRNARLNILRLNQRPIYGQNVIHILTQDFIAQEPHFIQIQTRRAQKTHITPVRTRRLRHPSTPYSNPDNNHQANYPTWPLLKAVLLPADRLEQMKGVLKRFSFFPPAITAPQITLSSGCWIAEQERARIISKMQSKLAKPCKLIQPIALNQRTLFPSRQHFVFDSGKLRVLDSILRKERQLRHRVLLFTQMSAMLEILVEFLSLRRYKYLKLGSSLRIEARAKVMERFNNDPSYRVFTLTTRSSGLDLNLVGVDCVIFYDIDWSTTFEKLTGALHFPFTGDVTIYKLVCENTVEEKILKGKESRGSRSRTIEPRELFGLSPNKSKMVSKIALEDAMLMADDTKDREVLKRARWKAIEFEEDDPLNEFQDLERALTRRLRTIDQYALRFFTSDLGTLTSFEDLEKIRRRTKARSDIYFQYIIQLSAQFRTSESYFEQIPNGKPGLSPKPSHVTFEYDACDEQDPLGKFVSATKQYKQQKQLKQKSEEASVVSPQYGKEQFLSLCCSHVRNVLRASELEQIKSCGSSLVKDELIVVDDFKSNHRWPTLFIKKDVDRLKQKIVRKVLKQSLIHQNKVTVLPGIRVRIAKSYLPKETLLQRKVKAQKRTTNLSTTKPESWATQPFAVKPQEKKEPPQLAFKAPGFTPSEDKLLLTTVARVGQRWSLVQMRLSIHPKFRGRLRGKELLKRRWEKLSRELKIPGVALEGAIPQVVSYGTPQMLAIVDKGMQMIRREATLCDEALKASIRISNAGNHIHSSHSQQLILARRKLNILPMEKITPHKIVQLHKRARSGVNMYSSQYANHRQLLNAQIQHAHAARVNPSLSSPTPPIQISNSYFPKVP